MEAHDQIVHELLDIGETLLTSGAEINRVEDTMTRLGQAYGAQKVDIFVITSDIVLTILFQDGVELTQTRRICRSATVDFQKLEALNALSRSCCQEPLPAEELHARVQAIHAGHARPLLLFLGSMLGAGGFAVFFGGGLWDGVFAALAGALVRLLQEKILPVFRNAAVFQFLTAFLVGSVICLGGRLFPVLAVDKILIGVIMLLIPGVPLTNSVRDMLVGHTISGLLRLERLCADGYAFHFESHDLLELVGSCWQPLAKLYPEKTLTVTGTAALRCDEIWMGEAITNLLKNACEHTLPSGHIRISIEETAGEVAICLSDDGGGVSAEELPRLFERFYHGSHPGHGAGIGLAIVKEVVLRHHGSITAENIPGGLQFTLFFPKLDSCLAKS